MLKSLFSEFQQQFFGHTDDIDIQTSMNIFDYKMKYQKLDTVTTVDVICSLVTKIIKENNFNPGDVTILASSCDVLRDLEVELLTNQFAKPATTFETKQQYDYLGQKFGNSFKFKLELDSLRRVKKIHFTVEIALDYIIKR